MAYWSVSAQQWASERSPLLTTEVLGLKGHVLQLLSGEPVTCRYGQDWTFARHLLREVLQVAPEAGRGLWQVLNETLFLWPEPRTTIKDPLWTSVPFFLSAEWVLIANSTFYEREHHGSMHPMKTGCSDKMIKEVWVVFWGLRFCIFRKNILIFYNIFSFFLPFDFEFLCLWVISLSQG